MQFIRLSILTGLCSLAYTQIPDKFENLKVIPKDVTRTQLVRQMRNMAGDLGVRCNYCHVGESEDNLIGYDFATDEKQEKKTARDMMKLVNELNGGFFAESRWEGNLRDLPSRTPETTDAHRCSA